jgi:hypothetical protein
MPPYHRLPSGPSARPVEPARLPTGSTMPRLASWLWILENPTGTWWSASRSPPMVRRALCRRPPPSARRPACWAPGTKLLTGCKDKKARLFAVPSGQLLFEFDAVSTRRSKERQAHCPEPLLTCPCRNAGRRHAAMRSPSHRMALGLLWATSPTRFALTPAEGSPFTPTS